ncbi:MAG TPA: hydratase [Clostridia bacterium]|nr:hydratase [Clostridia bacterium]
MFINEQVVLKDNRIIKAAKLAPEQVEKTKKGAMTHAILEAHNISDTKDELKLKFDAMASHDITYVGILQTASACNLNKFPIPYVLTNCHNSLCAVGGTINEDDHLFGLSAAKRYGGIYVPAHLAVIHQYMREMMSGCGKMILGSDSHTRYGALGTLAIGEGGGELAKQLLGKSYNLKYPKICLVYLTGCMNKGVGPHDVAIYMIGKVFKQALVTNMILEFAGPGIKNLSMDDRMGIDVMTTETACLSSIWATDEKTQEYYETHGRKEEYKKMHPADEALYDCALSIDLSKIEPMIALPYHPSNAYTIRDFLDNSSDILDNLKLDALKTYADKKNKSFFTGQGIIAGCAGGTFENIIEASAILEKGDTGSGRFSLSVYPQSQPVAYALNKLGCMNKLMESGVIIKTAFCGPCFGAGDVPANNTLSVRHTTRNFENREGSIPKNGQAAYVALMDARSIAATALNKGYITAGTDVEYDKHIPKYEFNRNIYEKRVYNGYNKPNYNQELIYGPNIKPWPEIPSLPDNLLLKVATVLTDEVTTTDELIPSGETSSYRSNPLALAEFTLSRKAPDYVKKAKLAATEEGVDGHLIFAKKPGDGSAREQAASCQRVLKGYANICFEYATKRYRSNLINWGMLPFTVIEDPNLLLDEYVYIPNIRQAVLSAKEEVYAYISETKEDSLNMTSKARRIKLYLKGLSKTDRDVLAEGCMINYYRKSK